MSASDAVFADAATFDFGSAYAGIDEQGLPRRLTEFAFARSFDRTRFTEVCWNASECSGALQLLPGPPF
jgi:hypothetical protein